MKFWQNCIHRLIVWYTRQRKPPFVIMGVGAGVLALNRGVSWLFKLKIADTDISLSSGEGNVLTDIVAPGLGIFILLAGFIWSILSAVIEHRQSGRKRVIIIRGEGLRKVASPGLDRQVHKRLTGHLIHLDINVTQRIRDGYVILPDTTFSECVQPFSRSLMQHVDNLAPGDAEIVYAGTLPVPFTFWVGNALDDKGIVTICDWNREKDAWQIITDEVADDGTSFNHEVLSYGNAGDVVLAISCSYQTDLDGIMDSFSGLRIEHLKLPRIAFDNHWSLSKQQRLSIEFIEHVKLLQEQGARRIHLVLAAQSSIVLNFGRRYDSRNLPDLIVYQYEKSEPDRYPWGIYAITHGKEKGEFATRTDALNDMQYK